MRHVEACIDTADGVSSSLIMRYLVPILICCFTCQLATAAEVGQIRDRDLNEASGLVTSKRFPDVYWTHNDGDDGALYAIHRDGSRVGRVAINEKFRDWEDIATDSDGRLYLADTGNNSHERQRVIVYRTAEPDPATDKKIDTTETWKLTFPARPFNCESLFVWQDYAYLVSKTEHGQKAGIYRFSLKPSRKSQVLESVAEVAVDEPVTAADISADGKRLALLGRGVVSVFQIDGKIADIASVKPQRLTFPPVQAEGCCFVKDEILVVAETGELYLVGEANATSSPDGKPDQPSPPALAQPPAAAQSEPPAPTR